LRLFLSLFFFIIIVERKVNRWIVNRRFSSERPNFPVFLFYFHPSRNNTELLGANDLSQNTYSHIHLIHFFGIPLSGNKMENEIIFLVGVKSTIHCSPIHFLEIKWKMDIISLVGVKTTVHYSPITFWK
jgi:hypothetical protein